MGINYEILPSHLRGGLQRYIEQGEIPGGFLQAVIANNLCESFGRADEVNRVRMFDIVNFMHNEAPGQCWGSPAKMKAWAAR